MFAIRNLWFVLVLLICMGTIPPGKEPADNHLASVVYDYAQFHYPGHSFQRFVYVSVRHQELYLIEHSMIVKKYPVSTSKYGTGSEHNSEKTPLGLHKIHSSIGDNSPINGIIEKNGYTGRKATIISDQKSSDEDLVTTRAFHLEGMEKGKNKGGKVDSFHRDIFLHGTHEEGLIGTPASHGCIRMKNSDILELSAFLSKGLPVIILNY